MTFWDIVGMAFHNLWQGRMRAALNLIGVVIGCVVLLMTAAGATGVKAAFESLFDSSEFARQIEVYQSYQSTLEPKDEEVVVEGEMSEERRERIRNSLVQAWKSEQSDFEELAITEERLHDLAAIDHVGAVVPHVYLRGEVELADENTEVPQEIDLQPTSTGQQFAEMSNAEAATLTGDNGRLPADIAAAGPPSGSMKRSLLAGTVLEDNDFTGMLIHEFMAYKLGFRSDDELEQLVGRVIEIEWRIEGKAASVFHSLMGFARQISPEYQNQQMQFMTAFQQLMNDLDRTSLTNDQKQLLRDAIASQTQDSRKVQDVIVRQKFVVRGVYRPGAGESMSQLFYQHLLGEHVEIQIHRDIATKLQLFNPNQQKFHSVVLIVDKSRHLKEVTDRLKDDGLPTFSALHMMEHIDRQIDQNTWIVLGVAGAILLTAAIGISNTLIISVMERTPEFGIMKSLGARDRSLVVLMMIEGAILGLLGAFIAALLSVGLSYVAQIGLRMYLESEVNGEIEGSLFHFSLLPFVIMTAVSVAVCMAASIVPAIRAARLDPVVAMRRT